MLIQLRSNPTFRLQDNLKIDRSNLVIRDLVAMQADVEAIGHGLMSDRKTLEMMVELANQSERPIRGRFGHPGVSENATGKQIMTCGNFRIKEDKRGAFLVHDANFLPAARLSPAFTQDPINYIFTMAETAPSEFAESVVIEAQAVWPRKNGEELPVWERYQEEDGGMNWRKNPRPADAKTNQPVIRPSKFWYCDMVNEGALTHAGMFGAETMTIDEIFNGHSSQYAHEIFQVVDRWREAYHVQLSDLQTKVSQLLHAYISTRKDETPMAKQHNNLQFEPGEGQEQNTNNQPTRRTKPDASMQAATALLEQAEQLAQNASQQTVIMDQVGNQVVSRTELAATSETVASLQDQVAELGSAVRSLTERFNLLSARQEEFQQLTIKMQTAAQTAINHMQMQLASFQQNLQRMDGQPVVERPVRMNGNMDPLQPLQAYGMNYQQPAPGNWAMNQQPVHHTQRTQQQIAFDDSSPEGQAIRAQQRRSHYSV